MGTTDKKEETEEHTTAIAKKEDPLALVKALTNSYPEEKKAQLMTNVWLTMQNKTLTTKDEDNKNVKVKYQPAQALAYCIACDELNLNPIMNHVIMLEDQFYITLQGHMQNAHATGQLVELTTELVSDKTTTVKKTEWQENEKGKRFPKTVNAETKQFRYRCSIVKLINGRECRFSAEGVADETNVVGGDKASELKIEQMAEARSMRRCLSRAFPVGLGNYEDVQEAITYEAAVKTPEPQATAEAPKDQLADKIANAENMAELSKLKEEIKKSGKSEYVALYAERVGRLNNPENAKASAKEEPEQVAEVSEPQSVTATENVGPDQN